MITATIIKSPKADCKTFHEAHRIVEEALATRPGVATLEVFNSPAGCF